MSFLERFFGKKSAKSAKERLQLVLIHDRTDLTPAALDALKLEKPVLAVWVWLPRVNTRASRHRRRTPCTCPHTSLPAWVCGRMTFSPMKLLCVPRQRWATW